MDIKEARQRLAIIVKGNPKYLRNHKVKGIAAKFYAEIKKILEDKGYTVEFDAGLAYTLPKVYAALWVGHSRGIDRLKYAPSTVKTIELETKDYDQEFQTLDERGLSPLHYQLSKHDLQVLNALPTLS